MAANQQTLADVRGRRLHATTRSCAGRLHRVTVPVLVAWGEQDGIALRRSTVAPTPTPSPTATSQPIAEAGHFPQIEQLGRTLGAIGDFVDDVVKPSAAA